MRYTNIARRALALVCTAALAAIPALGLSACGGPSDEELIKQTLTADLDAIKTVDEDTVKSMMGDSAVSEMETYDIDAFAFYTNCVKQFSYDNVDVTVDGDSATATLDVTNVDIEKVMTSWANDVSAYVTSQEAIDDYNNLGENGRCRRCSSSSPMPWEPATPPPRPRPCPSTSRRATTAGTSPMPRSSPTSCSLVPTSAAWATCSVLACRVPSRGVRLARPSHTCRTQRRLPRA